VAGEEGAVTPDEWDRCTDPEKMLKFVRGKASGRKWRLFCCGCCRSVWPLLADARSRHAVEAAERFADGRAGARSLATADQEADEAARLLGSDGATGRAAEAARYVALGGVDDTDASFAARFADEAAALSNRPPCSCALVRCLFGNPFRPPPAIALAVLAYDGGAARRLAESIYAGRRFEELPVLADLLEEAGCEDAALLGHLRGPGPHGLGCHALDAILAQS
jgi:hypothetical protein